MLPLGHIHSGGSMQLQLHGARGAASPDWRIPCSGEPYWAGHDLRPGAGTGSWQRLWAPAVRVHHPEYSDHLFHHLHGPQCLLWHAWLASRIFGCGLCVLLRGHAGDDGGASKAFGVYTEGAELDRRAGPGGEAGVQEALVPAHGATRCHRGHPLECLRLPALLLPAEWVHRCPGGADPAVWRSGGHVRGPAWRQAGGSRASLVALLWQVPRGTALGGPGHHVLPGGDGNSILPSQLLDRHWLLLHVQSDCLLVPSGRPAAHLRRRGPRQPRPRADPGALDRLRGHCLGLLRCTLGGLPLRGLRLLADRGADADGFCLLVRGAQLAGGPLGALGCLRGPVGAMHAGLAATVLHLPEGCRTLRLTLRPHHPLVSP
mmetsp:Transcript_91491/g.218066  ORF Transcript_91491/g.218066 Transcript_91491/m.218066 type:complete len:374 (+) Transcript_91491:317-1438(+)